MRVHIFTMIRFFNYLLKEFISFLGYLFRYTRNHVLGSSLYFEERKNALMKLLMMKRGKYNRPFLHFTMMGVLAIGVLIAPMLADTYPIFSGAAQQLHVSASNTEQTINQDDNVFHTNISDKPRDAVVKYTVQRGDTLQTIAQKFSQPNNPISVDTIKWANDLSDNDITVGDTLDILPVTGVEYKVQSGDSVYTIAKKFNTNPQGIVDFPFNNFANQETFALVEGQMLIVPGGSVTTPSAPAIPSIIPQAPENISFSGSGFNWPVHGEITQGFSWYHNGIDIAGPIGTPVYASKTGVIQEASGGWSYGYGNHVIINHNDGYMTLYGHLNSYVVSVGQSVTAGQLIGYRGNTGRSTGPHTHFEIRTSHGNLNPLNFLP